MWSLEELHTDEALRRREFPVVEEKVFLAHAGVCPLPGRVAEAMKESLYTAQRGDQEEAVGRLIEETRLLGASLMGVEAKEVALVGPTSLGLSFVAGGFPWRRGDNVVIYYDDYPSNVYPWMALSDYGVEVRLLEVSQLGRIERAHVLDQVDEGTRLVALASCHFLSGYRIDLDAIGEALHARGIAFCVDGIQTLGAMPTGLDHVDFLAADAHKWMLGPCAAGLLMVREPMQEVLRPMAYGWHNVACPNFVAQEGLPLRRGAKRYEAGTHNLVGLVGLKAAMELTLAVGVDVIAAELLRKRAWLVKALIDKGYDVLFADAPSSSVSGIVTFFQKGMDMSVLHARLIEHGMWTSLRVDREGHRYIRISPHFYNTDEELHRMLRLL